MIYVGSIERLRVAGTRALVCALVLMAGSIVLPQRDAAAANLLVDASTGAVISAEAANHLWYPASLTKMMTLYVALSEVKAGRLSFEDKITVSRAAANVPPVRFGLKAGEIITVREAINAAIVASGNDAAVALAEKIGGSEQEFADIMTAMAQRIGMRRTSFRNATGLPDVNQVTTARDMAVLAMALLRDYPEHYPIFNQRSVTIHKKSRGTVNSILGSYDGADGFKTGFTCGSGYNLVASVERNGRRVVGVVLGSASRGQRIAEMTKLLNTAFAGDKVPQMTVAKLGLVPVDEAPPPTILSGGACSNAQATDVDGIITSAARLSGWGIVFGAYPEKAKARLVLERAKKTLGPLAKGGRSAIVKKTDAGRVRYSALLVGLQQGEASRACIVLRGRGNYCVTLSPKILENPGMAWR